MYQVLSDRSNYRYEVRLFGTFRLLLDDKPVDRAIWRRDKAKTLFKWLILNHEKRFSSDQLIALLWPDASLVSARRNLHIIIHYLRRLLEPSLLPNQESTYIHRDANNQYWLETNDDWYIDAYVINNIYNKSKKLDHNSADINGLINHYRDIVHYCQQGFLIEDQYDDIFADYQHEYQKMYLRSVENLLGIYVSRGLFSNVLLLANQALEIDPFCEIAICSIAEAHAHAGNIVRALQHITDFERFLYEEIGVEPSDDCLALKGRLSKANGSRQLLKRV